MEAGVTDGASDGAITCDAATAITCSGQCVDGLSPAHCGSCTNVCPGAPANGHATCAAPSTCGVACDTGFHTCGGGDAGTTTCLPDTNEPSADACVVTDALGVFVAPNGSDSAACTKAAPCQTIGKGVSAAKAANKRVYVCAGTYPETVVIDTSKDGVQIYGGFDCTGWAYSTSNVVRVAPTSGYALKLDTLTTGTRIEDIEFDGPNGVNAGDSSIAVFANAAQAVTFKRVVIKSGNGVKGADGTTISNYDSITQDDPKIVGHDAVGAAGGGPQVCDTICKNNVHSGGGAGGAGGASPTGGGDGTPALGGGSGGTVVQCTMSIGGHSGTAASPSAGGSGATASGSLSGAGWTAADSATDGSVGGPGQGGGGGGGGVSGTNRGGGGGGGCGGCGGGIGTRGRPGGSSLALVSFGSGITLDACVVTANGARDGGKGGDGQVGQPGGFQGAASIPGCNGGQGGTGGGGGGGGGGAGGLSVAILYKGMQPTMMNGTTATHGTGASGGAAGANGNPAATAGVTTAAQDVMMAP